MKRLYLERGLDGTVVTTRVDGMPHRVLRTELVEHLERSSRVPSGCATPCATRSGSSR